MNNDNAQVAVFIDYDNIEISVTDTLGKDADVEWKKILEAASRAGRVVMRRAYADWAIYPDRQRELLGLGIDLVHVSSRRGKNAADIRIVIDALEMLYSDQNQFSHVLLVSGDGDFTELVHRLRSAGKVVMGVGVSGTSAEYLVNACDEFIFYDKLVDATPQPVRRKKGHEEPAPSFDISEARLLLRRVLESFEGEWMLAAELKKAMLRLNPAFNERNYNFPSFKDFLLAQSEIIHTRTSGDQLEVQLIAGAEIPAQAPETVLDKYLQILAAQKIRMTPNEYRPSIIFKFHEYGKQGNLSLTQLKDKVHAHFEENAPHVTGQYITETAHQLFHTYCFVFDQDSHAYPADVRLWDRRISFVPEIIRATDLLDKCDKGLLQKIGKALGALEKIDKEVAAKVLYGSFRGERMLEHVSQLINGVK